MTTTSFSVAQRRHLRVRSITLGQLETEFGWFSVACSIKKEKGKAMHTSNQNEQMSNQSGSLSSLRSAVSRDCPAIVSSTGSDDRHEEGQSASREGRRGYGKALPVIAILLIAGTWFGGRVGASAGSGMSALKQLVRTIVPQKADQFVDQLRGLGPVPVSPATPAAPGIFQGTPSFYVLDNGNISIGGPNNARTTNSINTSGNLVQPWYKGVDGGFYKLTFSNYPLDIAFGGGSGSNWTGSNVTENPTLIGQVIDYSGFNITATLPGGGVKGYGTIVTRGMLSGTGLSGLELQHTYILDRDVSFLKVITQVRNTNATATGNVHMWIGTRDDFINQDDVNLKWKGNVVNGVFTRITSPDQPAQMVQLSNPTE